MSSQDNTRTGYSSGIGGKCPTSGWRDRVRDFLSQLGFIVNG